MTGASAGGGGVPPPPAPTLTVTVARFESIEPSHAAYVNESLPVKPANGKYVAVVPARPTVPLAGCDTIRSVRLLPSGSVATSGIWTGAPRVVDADGFDAIGGRFGFALSLDGPLWHM